MVVRIQHVFLFVFILFSALFANGQTRGMIIEPATGSWGQVILDPNNDGYVSQTTAGFISNDQAESEITFKKLVFPGTEPTSDVNNGPNCGFTDFVDSGIEDPAQYYYDATHDALIFRLRMGSLAPNAKSYSILIDTDQKFGSSGPNADPTYTSANPGFEIELVLATKFGVSIYNVDGTPNCTPVVDSTGHGMYQKSIAYSSICNSYNYFLDFYVHFSDLSSKFGITASTPLRMAIVDNMAADKSTLCNPSSASDIGGVDGSCGSMENCFKTIIDNYTPCPVNSATSCQDRSACPLITGPLIAGVDSVKGTSSEADGTIIKVFKGGTQIGTTTVVSGKWKLSGISPVLAYNDVITASATASGKSESINNCDTETVGSGCTTATTSTSPVASNISTVSGNKGINIANVTSAAGTLIRMYNPDGTLFDITVLKAGSTNPITTVSGTTLYSFQCQTGQCFPSGVYFFSFQEPGKCESPLVPYCFNTTTSTAASTLLPAAITTSTTSLSGTVASPDNVAGVRILLYVNGSVLTNTSTTAGGNWTISSLSFSPCDDITVRAIATGKCYSNAATDIIVSGGVTAAPVITGSFCTTGPITSVSGTSSEATGAVIQVYQNGTAAGSTTTVSSSGSWTVSGLSLSVGSVITAKATGSCKTQSAASSSVTITAKTSDAVSITTSPVYEGATSVSGTGTSGDVINLYMDGVQIPGVSATVSGAGTWTVSSIPNYEIYMNGALTATATSSGKCPSSPSAGITVLCIAPLNNRTISPTDTSVCASSMTANIKISNSELYIVYQLFNGATATGTSKLGTGGLITLKSGTISSSTKLNIKAFKLPAGTCQVTDTDSIKVSLYASPTLSLTVTATSPVCSGTSSAVSVQSSQTGYNYQLRNNATNALIGSAVSGTGGTITLPTGSLTANTTFNILVSGQSPSICSGQLSTTPTVTVNNCNTDLTITKTASTSSPNAGSTIIFTLTVTNAGPATATGVAVNDLLPNGYTYVSDNGAGAYNSSTGVWTIGSLANAASTSLQITATVNATGSYSNTATVSGTQTDPNLTNNSATSVPVPVPVANLAITKSVSNSTPNVGSNVTFTVTVNNGGPSAATGVKVTDLLPSGYTFVSDNSGGTYNSSTGIWNIGNVGAGSNTAVMITVTVKATGSYANTASVAGNETDPAAGNNTATSTPVPVPLADLSITNTAGNNTPDVGSNVVFTLTATNGGPSAATGVSVSDLLPAGYTYVSDNGSGAYNSTTGAWTIGNLANGASTSVQITATVKASGSYTNTASVTGTQNDPNLANNSATSTPVPVPVADLSITKTVDNNTPLVGSNVVFTLTVSNAGPSMATGVSVSDLLPSGYTFVSDNGSGAYISGTGVWTVGSVASGATKSLQITATVKASGTYLNTATISGNEKDPSASNNSATSTPAPVPVTDLSITNTVSNSTPDVGTNVVFTLTVTNGGPSAATGVSVSDLLPAGYTYVSDNGGSAYNSTTGAWTIGSLANGASTSIQITATAKASGSYVNGASVTGAENDPNLTNNSATSTPVPVPVTDLSITKTVSNSTPDVGTNVVFTITVTNSGPSAATGVSVTDLLPAGYTYVSDNGASTYNSTTGAWAVGSLANGVSSSIQITATVKASGSYANTASVTGTQNDPTLANNSATSTPVPVPVTDLSITKTVNNGSPSVGSNVVFTLNVSNAGPSVATGVSVSDLLPSGYTFVSDNGSGAYISGTGVWTVGSLASGSTKSLQITATVKASGTYLNTATISGNEKDPSASNNSASSNPAPGAVADLSITNTVSNSTPDVGTNVVFTLTVTNSGPSAATGVSVSDLLPAGYTYVSDNGGSAYNSTTGIWTIGNLANGASTSIQITATVKASGSYANIASVTGAENDPNLANNSAASTPVPVPVADLSITKTVSNSTPDVGSNVVFTLTVSNGGPSAATGVSVSDLLPSGYTFVSDNGASTYNSTTGAWTIGNLANGASTSIQITATVKASGSYTNTASVTGAQNDPALANNSATSTPVPVPVTDLSITNAISNSTPDVGTNVVFTLTVVNGGPSAASGVSVSDLLPVGYTYVSDNGGSAYNSTTGVWTIGNLANGASTSIQITATVKAAGSYANAASVTGTENDSNLANNSATSAPVPVPVTDLSITNAISNSTPDVGTNVVFTLTVANGGPSAATGVSVSDLLPAGYTYVSDNGGTAYNSTTGTWTIGNLANGANTSIQITAIVKASGSYANAASVTGTQNDPNLANNSATSTPVPVPVTDLSISNIISNSTPDVGTDVVFTLTVVNGGPSPATGVNVTDLLPAGYTYVSDNGGGAYNNTTGTWTIGNLSNGASASMQITATVKSSGSYANAASVKGTENDPNLGNNSATSTPVPTPVTDLSIVNTVSNSTPDVGTNVVFTLTATNGGPSAATGVSVSDLLPAGYTYVSDNGSGAYNSTTGAWTIGNLANGASTSIQITATVKASGSYTNTASVTVTQNDPNLANNSATSTPVPVPVADLSITKTVDNNTPLVGSNVVFTLTVSNAGPSTATGVSVSDLLPSGYTFVSDNSSGAYISGTGVWTVGSVASGATKSLQITATVKASGTYLNTATISGNEKDPSASNNSATSTPVPVPVTDLSITNTVSNSTPDVGTNVVFTLTVTNGGPSAATGVSVSDLLPAGYTYVSDNDGSAYNSTTGAWTIGSLANGASTSIQITATVKASGSYANIASVTGAENDPNLANNSAASTPVPVPVTDLSISNTINNPTPDVGSKVVITYVVTNNGPSAATGVFTSMVLPSGYTYVSDDASGAFNTNTGIWSLGNLAANSDSVIHITAIVNSSGSYSDTAIVSGTEKDPDASNNTAISLTTPVAVADLAISGSVDNATPNVGSTVVFTLTITNNGPSTASGVTISDLLPSGYTYASDNSNGKYNSTSGTLVVGSLATGASYTVEITATVLPAGSYANNVSVAGTEKDPDLTNNSVAITTTPAAIANLAVKKTIDNPSPVVGGNVVFTLTVINNGPSDALNVVVTDNIPAGYSYVSDDASGSYDPITGHWNAGSIANGGTASLNITCQVLSGGNIYTDINYMNTCSVTSSITDPNLSDNNASIRPGLANLSVVKSVDNGTPEVGSTITFTIVAKNNGPDDALGVAVADVVPSGYSYVSSSATVGNYDPATGIWNIGALTNGNTDTLRITMTVKASGNYTNTAIIQGTQTDAVPGDNRSIQTTLPVPVADLGISESVDKARPSIGGIVKFTLTVMNAGPSMATGVQVNDLLPSGYTYVSDDANGGYNSSAGTWTIGTLSAGNSITMNITVRVTSAGNYTNMATVSGNEKDPDLTNNSASAFTVPIIVVVSTSDVSIVKTVDNPKPYAGATVTFTLVIHNNGPSAATGVTVTESLASGYTYSSAVSTAGTYNPATGIWTVGNLSNNGYDTLTVMVRVNESGSYVNTASISANQPDPAPDNNTSTVTPEVRYHGLIIPTAFSPNNDGANDVFQIEGLEKYPNNSVKIFNRWGSKVYEAKGYSNDWDGTNKFGITIGGNQLPVGTYFYLLDLGEPGNPEDQTIKGSVYLNR